MLNVRATVHLVNASKGWARCPECRQKVARVNGLPLAGAAELVGLVDYSGPTTPVVELAPGARRRLLTIVTNGTQHEVDAITCPRGHTRSAVLTA